MIYVVDAAAAVELVLQSESGRYVREFLRLNDVPLLHGPHHLDIEVVSALRGLEAGRVIGATKAGEALRDFDALRLHHHSIRDYMDRIWELRGHLSAYDAAYVALAESLHAVLITADAKLARSRGHSAQIMLIPV